MCRSRGRTTTATTSRMLTILFDGDVAVKNDLDIGSADEHKGKVSTFGKVSELGLR